MLALFDNWGRSATRIIAVLLLAINLVPNFVASPTDQQADGAMSAIAWQATDHEHDIDTHEDAGHHGDVLDCNGVMCLFSLLPEKSVALGAVYARDIYVSAVEHPTMPSQAPPHHPPRANI